MLYLLRSTLVMVLLRPSLLLKLGFVTYSSRKVNRYGRMQTSLLSMLVLNLGQSQ